MFNFAFRRLLWHSPTFFRLPGMDFYVGYSARDTGKRWVLLCPDFFHLGDKFLVLRLEDRGPGYFICQKCQEVFRSGWHAIFPGQTGKFIQVCVLAHQDCEQAVQQTEVVHEYRVVGIDSSLTGLHFVHHSWEGSQVKQALDAPPEVPIPVFSDPTGWCYDNTASSRFMFPDLTFIRGTVHTGKRTEADNVLGCAIRVEQSGAVEP